MDTNNTRSPKRLVDLCVDNICRNLPYLESDLPPGLPHDVVDDIVKSLMKHAALNATTLRILRNCELGALSLAGCRGVTDEWLQPLSSRSLTASPVLSHVFQSEECECVESMDLDCPSPRHYSFTDQQAIAGSEASSCSTSSFVSASSTPYEGEGDCAPHEVKVSPTARLPSSPIPMKDFVMHSPSVMVSSPTLTSYLTLLDLRGSQQLTDRGLMQLHDLGFLEVAKLDGCHSLVGRGLLAFAGSHRLHTLSLANCRRLTDEAVINISHLNSIEALTLDGCRCLTDRSLAAISSLYNLQKLDLSQCDLLTDEGLEHLHDLETLNELSVGWCRLITGMLLDEISNRMQCSLLGPNLLCIVFNCLIADRGLDTLTKQPGRSSTLRVLCLARCPITDEGIVHLGRLLALEELDLNGCASVGSNALGNTLGLLSHLTSLDVSYCPGIL